MRSGLAAIAILLLTAGGVARAACPESPGDVAELAAARDDVEGTCPCAAAAGHGAYVRCAADVVRTRVQGALLRAECGEVVMGCARRSTCGRPGAVTCCRTTAGGRVRCAIRRDASRCTPPAGGTSCVGAFAACCDACTPSGCATTSTTTTSTSTTTTTTLLACDDATAPACNGVCPPGEACGRTANFDGFCFCHPTDTPSCGESPYPTCGGVCPVLPSGPTQCQAFFFDAVQACICTGQTLTCGCGVPGICPGGQICLIEPPCGCVPP